MMKQDGLYRRLQQMQNLDSSSHGLQARTDLHGESTKESRAEPDNRDSDFELTKEQVSQNSRRAWLLGREYMSCTFVLKRLSLLLVSLLTQYASR